MAMLLAFEQDLPRTWIDGPSRWRRMDLGGLQGRTLGLLGLGGIGAAVATRALPFGMSVRALRRSKAPSPVVGVELVGDLDALLSTADHLVLALPSTPETRHVIDHATLARVKRGVHLVNVARGTLVDRDALREALDDGRVACASLDTSDPEPVARGHWPPHMRASVGPPSRGACPARSRVFVDLLLGNLRRYQAGEPLAGLVDVHGLLTDSFTGDAPPRSTRQKPREPPRPRSLASAARFARGCPDLGSTVLSPHRAKPDRPLPCSLRSTLRGFRSPPLLGSRCGAGGVVKAPHLVGHRAIVPERAAP